MQQKNLGEMEPRYEISEEQQNRWQINDLRQHATSLTKGTLQPEEKEAWRRVTRRGSGTNAVAKLQSPKTDVQLQMLSRQEESADDIDGSAATVGRKKNAGSGVSRPEDEQKDRAPQKKGAKRICQRMIHYLGYW